MGTQTPHTSIIFRLLRGALVLAGLCLVFRSNDGLAADLEKPSEKVSVVVVMDSSASMRVTDPQKLREEGARLLFQFLKPGDKVAIVGFSDTAQVIRPLQDFTENSIYDLYANISRVGDSGIYTNLAEGLRTASTLLPDPAPEGMKQVVMLLSDGKLEPAASQGSAASVQSDLFSDILPKLRARGVTIYTLAFSDEADTDLLSKVADSAEGISWFAETSEDIHKAFADLFLSLKKPQVVPLTSKGFVIDSDVQEATFYINNADQADVVLRDPAGNQMTRGRVPPEIKWYKAKKFDVITIEKPAKGAWSIVGLPSAEGFATVLTNLRLLSDWPTSITEGSPATVQARLYEDDKPVVLPEMTEVTQYAYQVTPSDKVAEPIIRSKLHDDGRSGDEKSQDGIFSDEITLDEVGEYTLRVVARGPTFERQLMIPFRVRPRLVSLSVKKSGEHEETFMVELSPDAESFRSSEVALLATDSSRRMYRLPLQKGAGGREFFAPTSILPEAGKFTLKATLEGKDKGGDKVKAESPSVEYMFTPEEGHSVVVEVAPEQQHGAVEEIHQVQATGSPTLEPAEQADEGSSVLDLLLLLFVALAEGGIGVFFLRKTQRLAATSVTMDEANIPNDPELETELQELEALSKLEEVDFSDERFQIASGSLRAPSEGVQRPSESSKAPPAPAAESSEDEAESSPSDEESGAEGEESDEAEAKDQDASPEEAQAEEVPAEKSAEAQEKVEEEAAREEKPSE